MLKYAVTGLRCESQRNYFLYILLSHSKCNPWKGRCMVTCWSLRRLWENSLNFWKLMPRIIIFWNFIWNKCSIDRLITVLIIRMIIILHLIAAFGSAIIIEFILVLALGVILLFFTCKCAFVLFNEKKRQAPQDFEFSKVQSSQEGTVSSIRLNKDLLLFFTSQNCYLFLAYGADVVCSMRHLYYSFRCISHSTQRAVVE